MLNCRNYPTLFLLFAFFFIFQNVFSQKELKDALTASQNQEKLERDSLFKLIPVTKDDTLRIDLYFLYFELSDKAEWIKYAPAIIRQIDSVLSKGSITPPLRNALLNRKAMASRYEYYYYNNVSGAGNVQGLKALDEAISIYKTTGNNVELCQTYVNKADDYWKQGKLLKQFQILQEGLNYETEQKFNRGISRFYVQLQLFYAGIGDTTQVLNYIDKALALEKTIADPTREARGFYLAGLTYSKMKMHQKSIEYLLKSITSFKKSNMQQKDRIWQTYNLLAEEYIETAAYNKALAIYEMIIEESRKKSDLRLMVFGILGQGKAKSLLGEHEEALKIHKDVLRLVEDEGQGNNAGGRICCKEIGEDYYRSGNYNNARKYIERALAIAKDENASLTDKYNLEETAYKIDSAAKYYEGAYKHYYQINVFKEQFKKDEVTSLTAREKFLSELSSFKSDQEKQNIINAGEKKKQRIVLYSVSGFLVLVVLLAVLIFMNLRKTRKTNKIIGEKKAEVEKQKHLVEEKQKEIVDSIIYAQRLQNAILPPPDFIHAHLPHNFILYKPKDIVAGDFYWAETVGTLFFIAAADSTGHGVPGAMVSVVCSNALNRAVKEFRLTETGKILDKTRDLVLETFEKSTDEVKDGMDISLLCVDKQNRKVFWSGANNPLWYIHNNELKEIKADKQPIGKTDYPKLFTTHEIDYIENTAFYLFTDGFADQFGGLNGKKFKYKQLSELLLKNSGLPQKEQLAILDKVFTDWKSELEQVDDVCVIGVRI